MGRAERGRDPEFVATAKLNGVELLRWLTDTGQQLPICPNSKIDSFLPFVPFPQCVDSYSNPLIWANLVFSGDERTIIGLGNRQNLIKSMLR